MDRLTITGVDANEGCDITEVHYSSTTPNAYTEQVGSFINFDDDGPSISGTLSGAPMPTVDESNFAVDGTGNFAPQFTPVYGADGPAATPVTYALSTPGGASGLVDTATGQSIVLSVVGGVIQGRTATSDVLCFTVSVDASGVVTLDQIRSVVHPTTDPDESKTLSSANLVVLTATAHDKDGDAASAGLNIGAQLIFYDDGPSISGTLSGAPTPTVDESNFAVDGTGNFAPQFTPVYGADGQAATPVTYALSTPGGNSGLVDTATGQNVVLSLNGSGQIEGRTETSDALVFVISVSSAGVVTLDERRAVVHADTSNPDDSRSLSASLVVLTATAHDKDGDVASAGLNIGAQLNFKDDGPTITGTLSGAPLPTVDESALGTDDSDSFAAQFTPSYGADGAATTPVTYGLSTPGGDSGLVDTETGNAVWLFNESGTVVGREGTSALDAVGGDIVFVAGVDASGNVSLDQQRAIVHPTSDPDESKTLSSAGLVVLTATAHDKDGDTAFKALDIGTQLTFKDDGPSIAVNATTPLSITDDESVPGTDNFATYAANFTSSYGADGSAGTPITYAIAATSGADSGLMESGTGNHVFLFNESGVVVGRAGTNALTAAAGNIVFTATIDATGKVTLDQRLAVVHTPNNGVNDSTTLTSGGLVQVTATAHDGDGDTAAASLNIGTLLNFVDDAPTITAQILGGTVAFATGSTGTTTHSLNGAIGADVDSATQQSLSGVKEYVITSWDTPTNVYANLNAVLSADGTILTYYSDVAHTNAVYRLTLDQTANGGAGSYTFDVLQPPPFVPTHFNFLDMPSGQNLLGTIAQNKGNIDTHGTATTTDDTLPDGGILVFPTNPVLNPDGTYANTSGTINTSQGGGNVTIGNTNQAFDHEGEGAWFMFVDNPLKSSVGGFTSGVGGLTPTTADDADTIGFDGMNQSTDSSVKIVQASGKGTTKSPGPAMHITAYEATPGHVDNSTESRNVVLDPTSAAVNGTAAPEVNIIGIKIHDATGAVIEYRTLNQATGVADLATGSADSAVDISFFRDFGSGTVATSDDIYSALVSNLKANYTVEFITATSHDLVKVEWAGGSFDIGGFDIINQANVPAQDFNFKVQISDYDNDVYGGSGPGVWSFGVHVNDVIFA
jgi:hypothetical protein